MPRVFVPDDQIDDAKAYVLQHYATDIAAAAVGFASTVYQRTQLPFRVVEAARIRTAQINGCRTCQTWRAARDLPASLAARGGDATRSFVGRGDPAPDDEFYDSIATWRTATNFDDRERLAIEFAERMGSDPHSFETADEFWSRMHSCFTDDAIVDLTLSVASWIALGRTLHALDIDPVMCGLQHTAALRPVDRV
jgi:alkylhydroperoxidase family enzyme